MITCAHTMRKNTISCLRKIRKNKDDLANTAYKYETQSRGNSSDIHNDQNHISLTGMVPYQGCPTRRYKITALCDLFANLKKETQLSPKYHTQKTSYSYDDNIILKDNHQFYSILVQYHLLLLQKAVWRFT